MCSAALFNIIFTDNCRRIKSYREGKRRYNTDKDICLLINIGIVIRVKCLIVIRFEVNSEIISVLESCYGFLSVAEVKSDVCGIAKRSFKNLSCLLYIVVKLCPVCFAFELNKFLVSFDKSGCCL